MPICCEGQGLDQYFLDKSKDMGLLHCCCFCWLVNILKASVFAPNGLIRLVILSHFQRNAVVVESVLLRASLPLIHANAIDLLTSLISRYAYKHT